MSALRIVLAPTEPSSCEPKNGWRLMALRGVAAKRPLAREAQLLLLLPSTLFFGVLNGIPSFPTSEAECMVRDGVVGYALRLSKSLENSLYFSAVGVNG